MTGVVEQWLASGPGFDEIFERATGHAPFPYQRRLALSDPFPSLLDVPTGAGKTAAAILSWLWRRRFASEQVQARTPRRLVYCLPMRVLVEQTHENASKWLKALDLLADKPRDDRLASDHRPRIAVSLLMGGEAAGDWDAYPERDAVLIGTQDMLLSRALNRGYGMSRYRWPMHFALLNNDCLWVMDEVQLMGAGLPTTAQLQAFRSPAATGGAGLGAYGPAQSLWMSATLQTDALQTVDFAAQVQTLVDHAVGLDAEDRGHPPLSGRLDAKKPLSKAQTVLDKADEKKGYARDLASEIADRHCPGTLSLVVLNRVKRAQDVFEALAAILRKRSGDKAATPELILIHSRFRPAERQALQARLQEADRTPPPGGCIAVATQAIEAGVDVSARLLFTELAPWTSLVQRFGRCNRRGEWAGDSPAEVLWVDMVEGKNSEELAKPYEARDLAWARETLTRLTEVGLQAIAGIEDPSPSPLTHVLRRRDLLDLFDTTPDLAGNDLDVSRYIRDGEDNDVQVYWREWAGDAPPEDATKPCREELCPVSLSSIRGFLKNASAHRWDGLERQWVRIGGRDPIWPGVTLLVQGEEGGYDPNLGWTGGKGRVQPVPPDQETAERQDAMDDDRLSFLDRFVHLAEHSDAVAQAMDQLVQSFRTLPEIPWDDLRRTARSHDAGKSHQAFQNMLLDGLADDDPRRQGGPWAKSDKSHRRVHYWVTDAGGKQQDRRHFRHELASALLLLQDGGSDLATYLVAAHHGKVRLSIRSLPGEVVPPGGRRFARGVWEGDALPALDLGAGVRTSPGLLRLSVMELGEGADGPSWLERTLTLRNHYGPFRLAWLETLVRVADWRGTLASSRTEREEVIQRV